MQDLPTTRSYGFNVRRTHRAFDRLLHAYLTARGLKAGFWYYLRLLWIEDGLSQKQLSDLNNVAENTTAAMIKAMVADGLVVRAKDPDDGRRWCVSLTRKGADLREHLLPYAVEVNEIAKAGIDVDELETCLRVLQAMSANLETAFSRAHP